MGGPGHDVTVVIRQDDRGGCNPATLDLLHRNGLHHVVRVASGRAAGHRAWQVPR